MSLVIESGVGQTVMHFTPEKKGDINSLEDLHSLGAFRPSSITIDELESHCDKCNTGFQHISELPDVHKLLKKRTNFLVLLWENKPSQI